MGKATQKSINTLINECRHSSTEKKVISSPLELFENTNDGMVSYELGHEYEKIGKSKEAVKYYEKAEALFKSDNYKNMARAAINNIVIEALITENKKKTKK